METCQIQTLTDTFEGHAQQTENGVESWLARDLQQLLGYAEWRNFNQTAISKAKTACEVSLHRTADHFVDVNKMVELGSGSQKEIKLFCPPQRGRLLQPRTTPWVFEPVHPPRRGQLLQLGVTPRVFEPAHPPQRGQLLQPRATPWVFESGVLSPERAA